MISAARQSLIVIHNEGREDTSDAISGSDGLSWTKLFCEMGSGDENGFTGLKVALYGGPMELQPLVTYPQKDLRHRMTTKM